MNGQSDYTRPFPHLVRFGSAVLALVLAGCSGGGAGGSSGATAGALPLTTGSSSASSGGSTAIASGGGGVVSTSSTISATLAHQADASSAAALGSYSSVVQADGPAAYFRLGESSGSTAIDTMHAAITGQYRGSYSLNRQGLIIGDSNPATYFSGGNVLVKGDLAAQPTQQLTLEAWVNPDISATTAQQVKIISNGESWSAPYDTYLLSLSHGAPKVSFVINGTSVQVTAATALHDSIAHHLVGTYDGNAVRLWVDGQLAGTTAASGSITNYTSDGLGIGSDAAGQWAFGGTIDEVAIYPKALSLNRILVHEATAQANSPYENAVIAASPVAFYRMNENHGATAYDAAPAGYDGTYGSAVTLGATGPFSPDTNAASFNGDIISIPRYSALFPSQALTVEAIINPTQAAISASDTKIFSAGTPWSAPYDSYKLSLFYGQPALAIATSTGNFSVAAPLTLSANTIYHLAGTYDGSKLSMYVNGSLLKSVPASGALFASSGTGLAIGGDITRNWIFRGTISDMAVYPTALSATALSIHSALVGSLGDYSGSAVATAPSPTATATPTSSGSSTTGISFSKSAVNLLSLSDSTTSTVSQTGYYGGYALVSTTCSNIASVTVVGNTVSVVARGAGSCQATVGDINGHTANLPIVVTITSIQGQ